MALSTIINLTEVASENWNHVPVELRQPMLITGLCIYALTLLIAFRSSLFESFFTPGTIIFGLPIGITTAVVVTLLKTHGPNQILMPFGFAMFSYFMLGGLLSISLRNAAIICSDEQFRTVWKKQPAASIVLSIAVIMIAIMLVEIMHP